MIKTINSHRFEIKMWVNNEKISQARDFIEQYTHTDPHSSLIDGEKQYTVRSIYFDTPNLDFYYDKLDGLKVRKKVRIRAYNNDESSGFIEIKRRYNNRIIKERVGMAWQQIKNICHETSLANDIQSQFSHQDRIVVNKFIYNLYRIKLEQILLVVYEREAFLDILNENNRATLDKNVRICGCQNLMDLFNGNNLLDLTDRYFILEFKFNDFMPKWMRMMIRNMQLRPESISKYCLGIDRFHEMQR